MILGKLGDLRPERPDNRLRNVHHRAQVCRYMWNSQRMAMMNRQRRRTSEMSRHSHRIVRRDGPRGPGLVPIVGTREVIGDCFIADTKRCKPVFGRSGAEGEKSTQKEGQAGLEFHISGERASERLLCQSVCERELSLGPNQVLEVVRGTASRSIKKSIGV